MSLAKYRIWITTGPHKERYVFCKDMDEVAKWLLTVRTPPEDKWGIEKFSNDSFVDAFYSDDFKALYKALVY